MKTLFAVSFVSLFVSAAQVASAASEQNGAKSDAPKESAKEERPAVVSLPKSVFELSTQFKDPFHPRSTRRVTPEPGGKNEPPPPDVQLADFLVLNGLSGSANQRLAIINGRTFSAGEEGEVTTQRGKVKIRCLEIRAASVMVAVGAESTKAELKLKD